MKRYFILIVLLMVAPLVYGQTGEFDILTGGVSVASKTVDLRVPTQTVAANSVSSGNIVDDSITDDDIASDSVALNGSSTVDFAVKDLAVAEITITEGSYDWTTRGGSDGSLAADATVAVADLVVGGSDAGFLTIVNINDSRRGLFFINGTGATVELADPDSKFSPTAGTPDVINVYVTGNAITIQNKYTSTKNVKWHFSGFDQ